MANLIEGIQEQINRVRDIVKEYDSLPNNAGAFASAMMKLSIKNAEKTIVTGDTVAMLSAYKDLQEYEM